MWSMEMSQLKMFLDGRCILASGSPFDTVQMKDGSRTFYPTLNESGLITETKN